MVKKLNALNNGDQSFVTVAILDSGIDKKHKKLQNKIFKYRDFVERTKNPYDPNGHGTSVFDILTQQVLYENIRYIVGRVLDKDGCTTPDCLEEALCWSLLEKADIVSLSIGSDVSPGISTERLIDALLAAKVTVITSSGNNGIYPTWPASQEGVVAIGAASKNLDHRASFSSPKVSAIAPGTEVTVATKNGDYKKESGTSFAAPFVSGVLANYLVEQRKEKNDFNLRLNKASVTTFFQKNCIDVGLPGFDIETGSGILIPTDKKIDKTTQKKEVFSVKISF